MLLAIDLGNTTLGFGIFDGPRLLRRGAVPVDAVGSAEIFAAFGGDVPEAIAIASVNPEPAGVLADAIRRTWGLRPLSVRDDLPVPIENRYDRPEEVGADRLMNAVAARARYGREAIVVDFGTAIKFDLIHRDGAYLGGLILPGADMAARALAEGAALLPRVPAGRPDRLWGTSTREAIACGIHWGVAGAVRGILDRIGPSLGEPRIAATGGDAARFLDDIPRIEEHLPALTLEGIRLTYEAAGGP